MNLFSRASTTKVIWKLNYISAIDLQKLIRVLRKNTSLTGIEFNLDPAVEDYDVSFLLFCTLCIENATIHEISIQQESLGGKGLFFFEGLSAMRTAHIKQGRTPTVKLPRCALRAKYPEMPVY